MAEKEYIERGAMLDEMRDCKFANPESDFQRGVNASIDILTVGIKHLPTADVVEVRHGEWERSDEYEEQYGYLYKCSVCGVLCFLDKYCPNCGAKMDGATDNNVGDKMTREEGTE